VKNGAVNPLIT